jgi:hypothetical protein
MRTVRKQEQRQGQILAAGCKRGPVRHSEPGWNQRLVVLCRNGQETTGTMRAAACAVTLFASPVMSGITRDRERFYAY